MGDWVLLDEVNLAPSDTLQRLSGLLDATSMGDGGLCLTERGDVDTLVSWFGRGNVNELRLGFSNTATTP
jgi:midasin (ATPase involved in ribosome maturation)